MTETETMTRTRTRLKPSLDDIRWASVAARDKAADGTFVTAVTTTGIYCRPSCPARHPKRANVRFFETALEAAAAGFRPCKRCKPDAISAAQQQADKVAEACRRIETAEEPLSLNALAAAAGMSPYHFHRIFKSATGVTPKAYAIAHRNKRVRATLKGAKSVTEAIHDSGFNSSGRFYAGASKALGMTPTAFRSGGKGEDMTFAIGKSTLGSVLVSASAKGITAIILGDDPDELVSHLEEMYPRARLIGGDKAFAKTVARVVALVDRPGSSLDLPLDVRGTAFQHRVWQALCDIPAGETATYAEVARRIGKPDAVRAVAGACAANTLAVAIPCHRVVRTDGSLSGYRWGVGRKRALLDRERK